MKKKYLFITLLASLAMFESCKSSTKISKADNKVMTSLNAGTCFRNCKSYKLKIYNSGKGELTPLKGFDFLGTKNIEIKKDDLKELSHLLNKANFAEIKSQYLAGVKDLQAYEITYNGRTVKFHKMKAPQELLDVLDLLRSFIDNKSEE